MTADRLVLMFSPNGLPQNLIQWLQSNLPCRCETVTSAKELAGRVGRGDCDALFVDGREAVRDLLQGPTGTHEELTLAEMERRHIFHVLGVTKGNKAAAARILKIDTKTLYNRLRNYNPGRNGPGAIPPGKGSAPDRINRP